MKKINAPIRSFVGSILFATRKVLKPVEKTETRTDVLQGDF
jgi:hypothetical protein